MTSEPPNSRPRGGHEQPPAAPTIASLREAAARCTACALYRNATQTVFGEGSQHAKIMLVGEQPGDKEDLAGRPFVGPAGQVLDRALQEAGIDRKKVYVTNAVKHFKYVPRGKIRLHQKPNTHCAAVAPMAITRSGLRILSSRSYHCRQARISGVLGFWCRRIFPRGTNLKCLTALVT